MTSNGCSGRCIGARGGARARPGGAAAATTTARPPRRRAAPAPARPASRRQGRAVTDIGQLNDRGFNQLAFEGVKRAKARARRRVRACSSRPPTPTTSRTCQSLADEGYDLIIGVGFAQGEAVATVANEYPDTKLRDHRRRPGRRWRASPTNVVGLLFQEEEVGYLAGVPRRAEVAKREPGPDVISSRRRDEGAARRPLHRRLPGGRGGRRCRGSGAERVLAGLGRRGQVQGASR